MALQDNLIRDHASGPRLPFAVLTLALVLVLNIGGAALLWRCVERSFRIFGRELADLVTLPQRSAFRRRTRCYLAVLHIGINGGAVRTFQELPPLCRYIPERTPSFLYRI
jgi:hypothetical protein